MAEGEGADVPPIVSENENSGAEPSAGIDEEDGHDSHSFGGQVSPVRCLMRA